VALNLARPEGVAVARRLALWVDVVAENFAPGAMAKWGLDYASLVRERPDVVMISTCLNGQTGPHRFYPCFGGQGSALAGFNHLTGWPDREPVGPFGTITDSLSPRLAALLLASALLHRRKTGQGQHIDLSQVEGGIVCLTEMIVTYAANGDLHDDPQLAHREHFRPVEHAVLGRHPVETHAMRFSALQPRIDAPAPRLGEHTEHVLRELLGMPADEFVRLRDAGVFE